MDAGFLNEAKLTITPVLPSEVLMYGFIVFAGRSAPKGGPRSSVEGPVKAIESKARVVRNPGNEEAPTVQQLTYDYAPRQYSGLMDDKDLGMGGSEKTRQSLDLMCKYGSIVTVEEGNVSGGIGGLGGETYTGLLRRVAFIEWPDKSKQKYIIDCEILKSGYDDLPTMALPPIPAMYAAQEAAMRVQIVLLQLEAGVIPGAVGVPGLDDVLEGISTIQEYASLAADTLAKVGRIVEGTESMLKTTASIANQLNRACYDCTQKIDAFDLGSTDLYWSDYSKLENEVMRLEKEVLNTAKIAVEMKDASVKALRQSGWTLRTMRKSDTLERIAQETGSNVMKIRQKNGLGAANPEPGTLLLIPMAA